jgi:hypothetical protein
MARLVVFMAACAAAVGVSRAADFTVSAGSPTTLSAAEAAIAYDKVYVNDDLTIDGTICDGLTNLNATTIGASATKPVTVVVTNGAQWVSRSDQTMTFTGKGGTIVVSAPTMLHGFAWDGRLDMLGLNDYTNAFGVVGHYAKVVLDGNAESSSGVMDITRLLPNGTVAFQNIKNSNPNVDARILFEGGLYWIQNKSSTRFTVENNAKIILESIGGNPIYIRSLAQDNALFSGVGVLETRGDGDFILHHNRTTANLRTITLSTDESGSIVWGHRGRTVLKGVATWIVGADNVLPYGPQTGPIVFSCTESINATHVPISLDLNGKTERINGLVFEGKYNAYAQVTNSASESAKLVLGYGDTDGVLNGLISDGIDIEKVGGGVLVVSNATVRGTMTVKAGSVRFVGDNTFANPVAFDEGTTIVLSEDSQENLVRRLVRAPGAGISIVGTPRESYVKQGAGTVNLLPGSHLDGTELSVESGVLRFAGLVSDKWWRFTVRRAMNIWGMPRESDIYELNVLALWPTNVTSDYNVSKGGMSASRPWGTGRMLTYGLVTNSAAFTSAMTSYSQLPAGTCMIGPGEPCEGMDMDNSGRDFSGGADSLFMHGDHVCLVSTGSTIRENDESSWQHVIWRLADDVPAAASYGLCRTYWSCGPLSWTLESSADGETWTLRDDYVAQYDLAATNVAVATLAEAYALSEFPLCPAALGGTAGCRMWYNNGVPYLFRMGGTAADRLDGVKLRVASGATIDTDYLADSAISIVALAVDCEIGGGTITKFRPAASGTLELTGIDGKIPDRYDVPITLSEVIDAGNFASWSVTVNGNPSPATTLSWANGVLKAVTTRGTIITFR